MTGWSRFPRKDFAVGSRRAALAVAGIAVCAAAGLLSGAEPAAAPPEPPPKPGMVKLLGPIGEMSPSRLVPDRLMPDRLMPEGFSPSSLLPEAFRPGGSPTAAAPGFVPPAPAGSARVGSTASVQADFAQSWQDGDEEVTLLRGRCRVTAGDTALSADQMVLWRRTVESGERLTVYLDGNARLERPGHDANEPSMILDLKASAVDFKLAGERLTGQPATDDPLFVQAVKRRKASPADGTRSAQRPAEPLPGSAEDPLLGPDVAEVRLRPTEGRLRRIRIFPRSSVPFNVQSQLSNRTVPPEQVTVLNGGVNVLIDGFDEYGVIDMAADRVVIWTAPTSTGEFQAEQVQTQDTPFTIYLEGNIQIRQDANLIRAERAVYDAREERALMERAELRSFLPELDSDVRIRADRLRQLSAGRFHAQNAWTTTSTFGRPGYRVESTDVFLEPRYDLNLGFGIGEQVVDPATGMPAIETRWIRSYNNTLYVEEVPVGYFPALAGPADDPRIPLKQAQVGSDDRFGVFGKTVWDVYDLFGASAPPGSDLNLLLDYYGERGPGAGISGDYTGTEMFGPEDRYRGTGILYGVYDTGTDRLGGRSRMDVPPPDEARGRAMLRHRHEFAPWDTRVNAEIGLVSDYNFLEQYFEPEFDAGKDQENLLYGTGSLRPWGEENWAWELLGAAPLNEFETETGWYPRADLYGFAEPLFDGLFSYSTHSQLGYGDIDPADPPQYIKDEFFDPLPYATDVEGGVGMTRHQLDMPLALGPLNVVPFVLGEGLFQQEGIDGSEVGRLTGSTGVRTSMQFSRVFPHVHSRVFGLNGLAHKIRLEAEYRATETTESLSDVAQYNEIDDNAQERLRYRLPDFYFGGALPPELDPRFYGVRTGAGLDNVASQYYELVEDQQVVRLAVRQRLQTKSGPPGNMLIRDWMTFDTGVSLFPNADRDNFGETAGLLFADYGWFVGQRTKLTAGAQYDFFENGPQLYDVGIVSQRSRRGSIALNLRHIEAGTISSDIVSASYSYVMSPKWISTASLSVDIEDPENQGQAVTLTRAGADFLVHFGVNNNTRNDNFGVTFAIEPRIGGFQGGLPNQLSSLAAPPLNP